MAKSKLKHSQKNLKPDNPDYDLEVAFRNLEKHQVVNKTLVLISFDVIIFCFFLKFL